MKKFTVSLRNHLFEVIHEKIEGLCEDKTITIDPALKGKYHLDRLLHEGIHACFWDLSEEAVDEAAEGLAGLLWAAGYRRTGK